ncbi:nitroreductase family deazaflavin-dependent oxidoreductase [Acidiferrimicrobium sp. IK]|uniref:nitroreductase family deazaflavin-dependent oxidoreductase n=1 Tax=Acidiferrimicrobium sp. IK TaxID=2871700 RepID=UPI003967C105
MNEMNQKIIDEFRSNGGVVGGPFEGMPVLLFHHVGAKSGQERVNPVAYRKVDGGWAVFASFAGAPNNPAWYYNLLAHPETTIEVGTDTVKVTTREATGAERDAIWEAQKRDAPTFADYEGKAAGRTIPVLIFEPA